MTSRVGALLVLRYLDVMDYFKRWDGFTGEEAAELFTIFKRREVGHRDTAAADEEQPSPDMMKSKKERIAFVPFLNVTF